MHGIPKLFSEILSEVIEGPKKSSNYDEEYFKEADEDVPVRLIEQGSSDDNSEKRITSKYNSMTNFEKP